MTLPNFLVIGAAKAGTTSLYHYLRQHPDVYMPPLKEVRYSWYEGPADPKLQIHTREDYEKVFAGAGSRKAIGEASPQYLNSPTAPERIAADLPGVRLIVSLRDPVDRAYSSYLGRVRNGTERRGVEEAMSAGSYYVETSRYFPRLTRFMNRFGRERMKVVLYDDLAHDARGVVRELFQFLGVDPSFEPDVSEQHNRGGVPRSLLLNRWMVQTAEAIRSAVPAIRETGLIVRLQKRLLRRPDPLPTAIRSRLVEEFRDDIAATGQLIGRDLSHWLTR